VGGAGEGRRGGGGKAAAAAAAAAARLLVAERAAQVLEAHLLGRQVEDDDHRLGAEHRLACATWRVRGVSRAARTRSA
jgi:hypothetical protein